MSLTLNMVGGGGGGDVFATIACTYPVGSVCTATNGTITLTATDTSGSYIFLIPTPSSTPETWTITSSNGGNTESKTVSITSQWQAESVILNYDFYLIRSGAFVNGVTMPVSIRNGQTCDITSGVGYLNFSLYSSGGRRTDTRIDLTDYSALRCNITPGGNLIRDGVSIGLMQYQTAYTYQEVYNNLSAKVSSAATTYQELSLDISTTNGLYNIAVTMQSASLEAPAYVYVYDLYLVHN